MASQQVLAYLDAADVPYYVRPREEAAAAYEQAQRYHTNDYGISRTLVLEVDGEPVIAMIPNDQELDLDRVRTLRQARDVRVMRRAEYGPHFDPFSVGNEPPFGALVGMPVLMDASLAAFDRVFVCSGDEGDMLEVFVADFMWLERPQVAFIGTPPAGVYAPAPEHPA